MDKKTIILLVTIYNELYHRQPKRGQWAKAVNEDARNMIAVLIEEAEDREPITNADDLTAEALNIPRDNDWIVKGRKGSDKLWKLVKYASEAGCFLCYNSQIAHRYSNPTELKRCDGGAKDPNRRESWIDVQTRAIYQAILLILRTYEEVKARQEAEPII